MVILNGNYPSSIYQFTLLWQILEGGAEKSDFEELPFSWGDS